MKYILLLPLLISFNSVADHKKNHRRPTRLDAPVSNEMILPVVSIHDGDTIVTSLTLPPPLNVVSVRILGMDTPETPAKSYTTTGKLNRAKCVLEAERALAATAYLRSLQSQHGGAMTVKNFKYGAYAGRIVGEVYIGGINVAERMINLGYAVPYDGKSKRTTDWCKPIVAGIR